MLNLFNLPKLSFAIQGFRFIPNPGGNGKNLWRAWEFSGFGFNRLNNEAILLATLIYLRSLNLKKVKTIDQRSKMFKTRMRQVHSHKRVGASNSNILAFI